MNLIELYDGWLENISFGPDIEVKTAQLKKYINEIERDIVSREQGEHHILESLLRLRCLALNCLFEIHCTDREVERFAAVNERLYNLTRHMYERTDMLNDFIKSMPLHEEDDDIMVNAYLRLWDDAGSSVLEFDDDDFYGSYFAGMIDLLLMMDSDYIHIEDIMSRTHIEDRVLIIDDRVRNRIMDDGQSWNDGVLKNPKFSHLVICHAVHNICEHKNFSIPDLLRMNTFEVTVEMKIQHISGGRTQ